MLPLRANWASASHTSQYKHEESVPTPVRRSIHRVSALLETVDLEFDRVLAERDTYVASLSTAVTAEPLNVDSLRELLARLLPAENAEKDETYASLLEELFAFEIRTQADLEQLIAGHLETALASDKRVVELFRSKSRERWKYAGRRERIAAGVFFTHVGLVREMLGAQFGERWSEYQDSQPPEEAEDVDLDVDDDFDSDDISPSG